MQKRNLSASYFLFTQFSISTFDSCPLKFKKRYIENLKWSHTPDIQIKESIQLGNDFHLMANRYFSNLETGADLYSSSPQVISEWVENLMQNFVLTPNSVYKPEYKLRMTSNILRLEANLDLLILKDNLAEIWDWKTHVNKDSGIEQLHNVHNDYKYGDRNNNKKIRTDWENSMQTMVYMFVLKEVAPKVLGVDIDCANIKMFYWQPSPPKVLAAIQYSDEMHNKFRDILCNKIKNILEFDFQNLNSVSETNHCKYCEFIRFCSHQTHPNDEPVRACTDTVDEFIEGIDLCSVGEVY